MAERDRATRCPKGHECPTLARIFRTLNLQDSDVLNVYIVGSHMWGTCSKHSDWDLVIVTKQLDSLKPLNTHKGNLEAFILSSEDFVQFTRDHSMQVLLTLWLPGGCVLLERLDARQCFQFDQTALVKSLEHSKDRDLRIAEKHFQKGDRRKAKKILLHCVRYLELGAQIREEGRVVDYGGANAHLVELFDSPTESWEELLGIVQPTLGQLWARVRAVHT